MEGLFIVLSGDFEDLLLMYVYLNFYLPFLSLA